MQRILYKIIILSVMFALYSCGDNAAKKELTEIQNETADDRIFVSKAQFERSKMTLGIIEEKSFPVIVKTSGMIDVPPENRAVVNATKGGYIKTTPLLIGDNVRKGQALVTIENPEFVSIQQEYMEVNEQLMYLKSEFDRQKTMRAENITSKKSFLQAESTYKTAMARHNGLRKQLQMLNISPTRVEEGHISSIVTIYAPITGSITKVNVKRGTYVSPATAILEIIDNDHIHIELSAFEKDIMKLKKGQLINFKIPESSSEIYKAEVHLIGTTIEENRTVRVHGHIKNETEANFLTGMFVDAEIITESAFAKALPETALVEVNNILYGLQLDQETGEGYYFNKLAINIENKFNGFASIVDMEEIKEFKFLTKGVFHLINDE